MEDVWIGRWDKSAGPPTSVQGQKAKYSRRADVFRFAPNTGHPPSGSVFRRTHEPTDVPLAELKLTLIQPPTKQLMPEPQPVGVDHV